MLLRLALIVGTLLTGGDSLLPISQRGSSFRRIGHRLGDEDSRDTGDDVRSRLARSGAEIADAGARVARDVVAAIRSARSSSQGELEGPGASAEQGRRATSGGQAEESGSEEGSNGARVLGFLLVAFGAIFLFNKFFFVVLRSDITLPLILIVLGALVIASGRGR